MKHIPIHCDPTCNAVIPEHLRKLKITKEFLNEKHACAADLRWFEAKFPKGCTYTVLRQNLATEKQQAWESWIKGVVGGDVATAGDSGTATAGHYGTATAGYSGTATAGYRGTATAGYRGTATAGEAGVISIRHWDAKAERFKPMIGYIGEGGLKPGIAYQLDENCQFVERKPQA